MLDQNQQSSTWANVVAAIVVAGAISALYVPLAFGVLYLPLMFIR